MQNARSKLFHQIWWDARRSDECALCYGHWQLRWTPAVGLWINYRLNCHAMNSLMSERQETPHGARLQTTVSVSVPLTSLSCNSQCVEFKSGLKLINLKIYQHLQRAYSWEVAIPNIMSYGPSLCPCCTLHGPSSHRFWDTTTYWLTIAHFRYLMPSIKVTPFKFLEKLQA